MNVSVQYIAGNMLRFSEGLHTVYLFGSLLCEASVRTDKRLAFCGPPNPDSWWSPVEMSWHTVTHGWRNGREIGECSV